MPFVKEMIHAVWGTKNRYPFLTKEIKQKVIAHTRENAMRKEIFIDRLNGFTEHLHCLFGLNADMTIAKALQLIKGESAFWINREQITNDNFEWANKYFAASVSESQLDKVRAYIDHQEEYHKKVTFQYEYDQILKKFKLHNHD